MGSQGDPRGPYGFPWNSHGVKKGTSVNFVTTGGIVKNMEGLIEYVTPSPGAPSEFCGPMCSIAPMAFHRAQKQMRTELNRPEPNLSLIHI